ncbi:MAG TPA: DUF2249 domain-containing protein [Rhodothermales bacterium]
MSQTNEHLDVRPVEPRHRFEMIMGAYRQLAPGQTLELVVDHDPKCMYYTLLHDHGPEAFGFEYLEAGPETWRVNVSRRGRE